MAKNGVSQKLLKEWKQHCEFVIESSNKLDPEQLKEKKERVERALVDYQFFISTYFKHYVQDEDGKETKLAPFHLEISDHLKNTSPYCYLACQLFRGAGKSTNVSLFIPIWLLLQKKMHNFLLVSKSQENSQKLLSHIQAELEFNQLLQNDFSPSGSFKSEGDWTKSNFVVSGYDCSFSCIGRGGNPRGYRFKQYRVDYVVADDLDDDQLCRNEDRVKEAYDWFVESVMNTVNPNSFRICMVENLYSYNSVMWNFMTKIPSVKVIKANIIDDDGNPTWERFTKEMVADIRQRGEISFQREMMNTPITSGSVFKTEWIHYKYMDITPENYEFVTIYLDPSFSDKGDYKAISVVGKYKNEYHLLNCFVRKCSINTAVLFIYDEYEYLQDKGITAYLYTESSFSQGILFDYMESVSEQKGYNLPIIYDDKKKINKKARIEGMQPYFERGLIYFNDEYNDSPDFKRMTDQLLGFSNDSRMHDDAPDSLESAIQWTNKNTRNFKNDIIYTEEINNTY